MEIKPKKTQDPDEIITWAKQRGGRPARVKNSKNKDDPKIIRIQFEDNPKDKLENISWEEFIKTLKRKNLALVYKERTSEGKLSRFNKIVNK